MTIFLFQIVMAISIFYCLNWVGRHSSHLGYETPSLFDSANGSIALNFVIRAFAPTVLIIILSSFAIKAGFENLTLNIHYAVYFYFALRVAYVVLWGRSYIVSWSKIAFQILVGCYSAYWAYQALIQPRNPLFPDLNTIGNELWLAIAAFLYAMINGLEAPSEPPVRRTNAYIASRYRYFSKIYGASIVGKMRDEILELLLFSILIVENYNRPRIYRLLENIAPTSRPKTLGVAQVRSDIPISDLESVEMARKMIDSSFGHAMSKPEDFKTMGALLNQVISDYNKDDNYIDYVLSVATVIAARIEPKYATRWDNIWSEELVSLTAQG